MQLRQQTLLALQIITLTGVKLDGPDLVWVLVFRQALNMHINTQVQEEVINKYSIIIKIHCLGLKIINIKYFCF